MGLDDTGDHSGDLRGGKSPQSQGRSGGVASAGAPPPELQSGQDMLAWKREYNIRQREADWKRRQEELLTQKQVAWQIQRCERDNRLTSAKETRLREALEQRVYDRHIDVDRRYKERCRNVEIDKRQKTWEEKENTRLVAMHREAHQATQQRDEALAAEKSKQCEELRSAATERAERRRKQAELDAKREANIRKKEEERLSKAAEGAQKLKTDHVAKSNAIVSSFAERAVPADPEMVSAMNRRTAHQQHGHDGATPGSIL